MDLSLDQSLDQSLVRALAEERLANARRINLLRFIGVSFLLALFGLLGGVLRLRSWQGNLHILAPYWVVAAAVLVVSHHRDRVARWAGWFIGFVDMPMVFLMQWANLPHTPNMGAVAGYTMGVFVLLLFVDALSLDQRAIYVTAFIGASLEGLLQHIAGVEAGAIACSFAIMGLAAFSCAHGSRRITDLLSRLAHDMRAAELSRTAIQARDEFISVASHELRSPLTTLQLEVQGLLRAARKPNGVVLSEPVIRRLENADAHTQRLGRLVHNLLDVSRLTAGRLELEVEEVDLAELVVRIVGMSKEAMTRAACACTILADRPLVGEWDRVRVEQIVTNLLENAMKYGARAPIEVQVSGDASDAELVVRDHGVGIAAADQQRVFDRFERANQAARQPGLGLGLWITRQLVIAHGGTITVESQPRQGASFTIRLPRRHSRPAPKSSAS